MNVFAWIVVAANVVLGILTGSLLSFAIAAFVAATVYLTSDLD